VDDRLAQRPRNCFLHHVLVIAYQTATQRQGTGCISLASVRANIQGDGAHILHKTASSSFAAEALPSPSADADHPL